MARGMPSMVALLGLLAVAGYQHKDKIAEMLGNAQRGGAGGFGGGTGGGFGGAGFGSGASGGGLGGGMAGGGLGGVLSGLGGLLGGTGSGGGNFSLGGGVGELVDRFRQNGHADAADSWVQPGPNRPLAPHEVEAAVGADNIAELAKRTGLSREELLSRLATTIPEAVDKYTPDGRLPPDEPFPG